VDAAPPKPVPEEDEQLLRRFLAGNAAACRTVERWTWEIASFGRFQLAVDEREDVVQDTLASVWQAAGRRDFALRRGVHAFVRRVAVARCVDRIRRRRPTAELDPELPAVAPGPYEETLRRDEIGRLRWALEQLDERCRDLIRLHFYEDRSYAEIAARHERAEATMRVHMFNCMKAARSLLARFES
jgi:RNA polymerase sigma factor (sigma-70 family)